jgi:hypothetical protein
MLNIAHDRENSSELDAKYFVYDEESNVIYTGKYTQCLVVIGAIHLDSTQTLNEINEKSNGFLFE